MQYHCLTSFSNLFGPEPFICYRPRIPGHNACWLHTDKPHPGDCTCPFCLADERRRNARPDHNADCACNNDHTHLACIDF